MKINIPLIITKTSLINMILQIKIKQEYTKE